MRTKKESIFLLLLKAFDIDFGEDYKHVHPTWNSVLDAEPTVPRPDWFKWITGRQSTEEVNAGKELYWRNK